MTEDVFTALADPTRRTILDLLASHGHGTATTLAAALPVSRPAVIKHLAVLDRAGLVAARRHGREVRYVVQPAPFAGDGGVDGATGGGVGRSAGGGEGFGRGGLRRITTTWMTIMITPGMASSHRPSPSAINV